MTANESKPYLGYLNKLADLCNNAYHHSFDLKSADADCSA